MRNIQRLCNMAVHTGLQCILTVFLKGICRHCKDGDASLCGIRQCTNLPRCLVAVHVGHLDVHEDQVILSVCRLLHLPDGDLAILGRFHLKARFLQDLHCDLTVQLVVLHQQDLFPFEGLRVQLHRPAGRLCTERLCQHSAHICKEILHLVTFTGYFDINDILLYIVGYLIGWYLIKLGNSQKQLTHE